MSSLGPLNRYLVSPSGKAILIFASALGKILVSGVYFLLGSYSGVKLKPRRKLQALFDKHFEFCLSNMFVHLATTTGIV